MHIRALGTTLMFGRTVIIMNKIHLEDVYGKECYLLLYWFIVRSGP